jgi:hypothetical protein
MREQLVPVEDQDFCNLCLPNSIQIGDLTNQFYLAYDKEKDQYWFGDKRLHGGKDDIVWTFPIKPKKDPLNLIDEPEDGNDPLWDETIEWSREIDKAVGDTFKFEPSIAYEIVVSFTEKGWKQDDHGYLLLYIFHNAALLIEQHEQRTK